MRLIGYGGMMTESFVAIMALITAAILNQHLYFAINAPGAQTGRTAETAAAYRQRAGTIRDANHRGRDRRRGAASVGEQSIVSRTGGAPTLAFGMAQVLPVFGGSGRSGITSRSCSRRCSS